MRSGWIKFSAHIRHSGRSALPSYRRLPKEVGPESRLRRNQRHWIPVYTGMTDTLNSRVFPKPYTLNHFFSLKQLPNPFFRPLQHQVDPPKTAVFLYALD
jgi:hypothetical protein